MISVILGFIAVTIFLYLLGMCIGIIMAWNAGVVLLIWVGLIVPIIIWDPSSLTSANVNMLMIMWTVIVMNIGFRTGLFIYDRYCQEDIDAFH